jgi:hypothetical protein
LLLAAQQELKGKVQMAKDLEMVRSSMRRAAAAAGLLLACPSSISCIKRPRLHVSWVIAGCKSPAAGVLV